MTTIRRPDRPLDLFLRYDEESGGYYLETGNRGGYLEDYDTHIKIIEQLQKFVNHYGKDEIDRTHEESRREATKEIYLEYRTYNRSKNRSKSWIWRCAQCDRQVDDSLSDGYWTSYLNGQNYCSRECAEQSLNLDKSE